MNALVLERRSGLPAGAWTGGHGPGRPFAPEWRELLPDRVPAARGRVEVLIVEDDAAIAEMYRMQLEDDGYEVWVVGTAADAVAAIDRCSPDLVLLDVLLPGRDGFDVLEHLRQAPEPPPVVILSNYGDSTMMDRGLAMGALDYFVKSRVTPHLVSRSIPAWLRRMRAPDD